MRKNWVLQNKTKLLIGCIVIFLVIAVLADLLPKKESPYENTSFAMGSALSVKLYGGGEETASRIREDVSALENRISCKIEGSLVSELNKNGIVTADAAFADMLSQLRAVSEKTDGAFDVTIGALSALWDIGGANERIPSADEIKAVLQVTGSDLMQIENNTVTIPDGMALDLGGVGKGMACDAALSVLAESDCTGAVVASGGSVLLYGSNPNAEKWKVGVRDPDGGESDVICTLRLDACFVSTSGNYEKFFMRDGKRYCHILSPFDGQPGESGLKSVTVVAESGLLSDALSTACFLLGYENSLPVLERFDAQALFITDAGEIIPTAGIKDAVELI